jgi:MFS family permease
MLSNTSAWTYHWDVPNHGGHRGHALILYKLYVEIYLRTLSLSSDEIFDACGVITVGIGLHIHNSSRIWRIPFAFQFVPTGIMALGLLTVPESPRWLASKGRSNEALKNLAYLRRRSPSSQDVLHELAEIEAAIAEEREARAHLGLREAFFGRGNLPRFLIAFFIFFLQQWCGQNSVSYYAPQIFTSVSSLFFFALDAS